VAEFATEYRADTRRSGGISARTRGLLGELHRAGPGPFGAADAARLWGLEPGRAGRRLRMLAERGWLVRARHGLYTPVPLDAATPADWVDDPWLIAAKLYPTGYVGGWSACEHWGLTDQLFRELFVFTPDRGAPRRAVAGVTPIRVKVVKSDKVFGVCTVWRRSVRVGVSDPTRTLVDLLDDPAVGGGIRHTADVLAHYFASDQRDDALLVDYIERLGNRTVFKRLGYTAETLELGGPGILAACRSGISRGVGLLDPSAEARGPIVTRWNLRINVDLGADWTGEIGTDPEQPPRQTAASGAKMLHMAELAQREAFLYAGRTLAEWVPVIVARVAERFDPERVVLFGSLASGRAGPDSDIDLLVIFREQADRRSTAVALRLAVADIPAPIDFVVTDLGEIERRGRVVGLALEAALRDGKVVYSRA
jgi:predicted transcriptional regulator of viral defense system/predicted nucleotidyltransferase